MLKKIKPYSPLRYPGGKASISRFIADLARENDVLGGTYIELYAGGAGAALNLLFEGVFNRIQINDYDFRIYSMWHSVLNKTEELIALIEKTPITIEEWYKQKEIYANGKNGDQLSLGFATFFLNRTNRSGIIYKAGPIGGYEQKGKYSIKARFNKKNLIKRISKIASFKDQIEITNFDAVFYINNWNDFHPDGDHVLLYLDPPYYKKGQKLYLNNYNHFDHSNLASEIKSLDNAVKWVISYDNVPQIRKLYEQFRLSSFDLSYSLQEKKLGRELLVFSPNLKLIDNIKIKNRETELTLL